MMEGAAIPAPAPAPGPEDVSARDAAHYIFALSRELAAMAGAHRLNRIAAALELAQHLAAEALAGEARAQPPLGNAAPEDAA